MAMMMILTRITLTMFSTLLLGVGWPSLAIRGVPPGADAVAPSNFKHYCARCCCWWQWWWIAHNSWTNGQFEKRKISTEPSWQGLPFHEKRLGYCIITERMVGWRSVKSLRNRLDKGYLFMTKDDGFSASFLHIFAELMICRSSKKSLLCGWLGRVSN